MTAPRLVTPALAAALALALALPARGDIAQLTPSVIATLTPIDALPSLDQLEAAHGGSSSAALSNLRLIALAETNVDPGLRIRAVRVLAQYCTPGACPRDGEVHTTLATLATAARYLEARRGSDVLVLRAAVEALGALRLADDVALLAPLLAHVSRDVRAATARALRDIGSPDAIGPLRDRLAQEQVPQVRLALADALRVLGEPVP